MENINLSIAILAFSFGNATFSQPISTNHKETPPNPNAILDINAIHGFYKCEHNEDMRRRYDQPLASSTMMRSGFIAHEVEARTSKLGCEFSGVDAPKNKKEYLGLRYADFVVPLVKSVQKKQEIIDDQKERLNVLELNLKRIEKLMIDKTEVSLN